MIAYQHLETFVRTGRVSHDGLMTLKRVQFIVWSNETWVLTTLGRTIAARHGWKASFWVDVAMTLFGSGGTQTLTVV